MTDLRVTEGHVVREILREAETLPAELLVIGTHGRGGFDRFVQARATFTSILCAVDFSAVSHQAVVTAADLANTFHSTLTVVHVFDWTFGEHMDQLPPPLVELGHSLQDYARWQLHECVSCLQMDQPATEVLAFGRPAREILHVAVDRAADLIVMGVTGRGSVDLALLGSTANHVVRASLCPVLTVRAPGHGPGILAHIVGAATRVH